MELSKRLLYRVYVPNKKEVKSPLVVILHGGNERGDDNKKQIGSIVNKFLSAKVQKKHPSFLFIPQCPAGTQWVNTGFTTTPYDHYNQTLTPESDEMKMVVSVIKKMISEYSIDFSRIYIVGFSMGSSGLWDILSRYPDLFAAAIPISGVSDTTVANRIHHIPIWAFHGQDDTIAPVRLNIEMIGAINRSGGDGKLTVFENTGHSCVNRALNEPGLLHWLYSQRKNTDAGT